MTVNVILAALDLVLVLVLVWVVENLVALASVTGTVADDF